MAISKVTKVILGRSQEVLGLDDILMQIGAKKGDSIDFIGLAEVIGLDTSKPIILPTSFLGEDVSLTTQSATASPTNLAYDFNGGSQTIQITATGVYRISSQPEWTLIDRSFAKDGRNFLVNVGSNNIINSPSRSGTIVFTGKDNTTIATVSISQAGNPLVATITPNSTQSLTSTSGTTTITVRLSTVFSITSATLTNTTGFTLSSPTTSTSSGVTTYTYTLTRTATENVRSTSLTVNYESDSFSGDLGPVQFNQTGLVPTIDASPATRSFVYTGATTFYDVTSNTNWSATISGTGFSHSTSETTGFKTTAITGTSAGDRIYVRAASHLGVQRTGTATVTTTFGSNDVSDTVSLTQAAAPIFTTDNITITGFDVNSAGTITAPTTLTPAGGTIVYSTATNGGGTTYTFANGFPLVSSNTTRYATYTVTVPAGYQNTGASISKSISATQEFASTFVSTDIAISGFDVNYLGTITAPSVSPAATSIVYSTLTNGGGTTYTPPSRFPQVSSDTLRYCKATVTVPSGYFNQGASVSRTVSATQEFTATIDVSPNTHTFSNVGSGRTYSVASNTTWIVSNTPTWITIDDTTGGGSDTSFIATAASQPNPGVRRSGTLRVSTNTSANGIVSEDVSFEQPPLATWSLNNIPNIGDGSQYSVEQLKSSQNTAATGTEFFFNIPYTFDYMNNVAGSSFDRSNFGFWVNFGAGRSTTSNRLTTGNKTFTVTPNFDVNGNLNSVSYDVGQIVSIAETTFARTITRYMIGTVTAWNQSTRVLSVNIASTSNIVTDNTVTSYLSWEINQIGGDSASFPRIYTRNANQSGANRTTTIKIDDTNNAYEQDTLTKVITQPLEPLTGIVNIPASADTAIANIGGFGTYTNSSASTSVTYFSVGIKTNYSYPFSVTKTGSGGVWISTTFDGSATSSILVNSSTTNTTAFFIRYSTGGVAEITITDADGLTTTVLQVNITPQSNGGGGGGTPPVKPPIEL
jgi:hypothetical protein